MGFLHLRPLLFFKAPAMKGLSDIVTVSLGAAALVTLVYAKDRPNPTPGVRTAMELIGYKTQASLISSQRSAGSRPGQRF